MGNYKHGNSNSNSNSNSSSSILAGVFAGICNKVTNTSDSCCFNCFGQFYIDVGTGGALGACAPKTLQ